MSELRLSPHYYVLCLSTKTNVLFEAFRESLIEVENLGFPVVGTLPSSNIIGRERRQALAREVDECFGRHYECESLYVVLVGAEEMQAAFESVTIHSSAVIGRIAGDHTGTHRRDLGQIVWPVVREAMSGVAAQSLHDLTAFGERGSIASGLAAVVQLASRTGTTLLVEDDYHVRGSIQSTNRSRVISSAVDIRDSIDDVVDAVIENVLESGGNVVFMPSGTLRDQERIVLLLRSSAAVC